MLCYVPADGRTSVKSALMHAAAQLKPGGIVKGDVRFCAKPT